MLRSDLLVSRHIVHLFSACEQHPVAAVRVLAGDALNSWRCLALTHLRFLAGVVPLINSSYSMQLAFFFCVLFLCQLPALNMVSHVAVLSICEYDSQK
jgi:hypothetical protein